MIDPVPSPLLHPAYRRLFAAQVTSLLGTGVTTVALALLAYDMAGAAAGQVLGTALAIKMIAYVGIAPFAGAFLSGFDRKKLLIIFDVIRAGLVLCLPFISEIWQLYGVIFLLNACSACFTPLFQSVIPDLLPNEQRYTKALSYARLAYDLENLLSPTLAAFLIGLWHFDLLFMVNSATFCLSALLVILTTLPGTHFSDHTEKGMNRLLFGVKAYLKTPRLRGLLALYGCVACAGSMVIVNTVVYVQDNLGLSEAETAYALMAAGFGSMVAALTVPAILKKVPDRPVMIFGASLVSSALLVAMVLPGFVGLLVLWAMIGLGSSLIQTPAGRVLARSCKQGDRSAFFSAHFALSHALWFGGYLISGWFGSVVGLSHTFSLLAAGSFLLTLWALRLWPQNDPLKVDHQHAAKTHAHPHTHDDPHHDHDHEGWEGKEPHVHEHRHKAVRHAHEFVIDTHHQSWPK